MFFSLMSAFNIGFRDFNFGKWLRMSTDVVTIYPNSEGGQKTTLNTIPSAGTSKNKSTKREEDDCSC